MAITSRKLLLAGNWKMNGKRADLEIILAMIEGAKAREAANLLLCLPAQLLMAAADRFSDSPITFGAQDCHTAASGAHTGDLSADMLVDSGATAIIVGHSERRSEHAETDALVCRKASATHAAGAVAIICIGETSGQRAAGLTEAVVLRQLRASLPDGANAGNTVIAYEPVWAIGTGLVPTADEIATTHAAVRAELNARYADGEQFRILYGGSVKPSNAAEILALANVDGALVGGASLKAEDFLGIVDAAR